MDVNHTVAGSEPEFSNAQILNGISSALQEVDMKTVVDLLQLLATQSPEQALKIVDAIELIIHESHD